MKKVGIMLLIVLMLSYSFGFFQITFAERVIQYVGFEKAEVTADVLNVRIGPSTSFHVISTLKKGERIEVIGKFGLWYAVYHAKNNCVGMAYSKFLKPIIFAKPTATRPPQPTATPKPIFTQAPSSKPPVASDPAGVNATVEEESLLKLINQARQQAGIGPLSWDAGVLKTARLKARDMVDKNYFSHQSPTYGSPFDMMRQFGVTFKSAGENIAGNQTFENAFNAWMNSPGHKQNILNSSFNYNGIGIADSPVYGKVFVQQFIGR